MNQYHQVGDAVVGIAVQNGKTFPFVIDANDYERVCPHRWYVAAKEYIATHVEYEGQRKQLYLHNFIMNRYAFLGKGQTETVDHMNRLGFDNRKCNLRIVSQSEQNINQRRRPRTFTLPADSGLTYDDIPRHIWYMKANGAHGDRFAIEFKTENYVWRTTSSKKVSLCEKLDEAKRHLAECYERYPHLNPQNPDWLAKQKELTDSYKNILIAATTT
jgi:hypothetical protein